MEIELWTLFDALMKWVIIPMAALLWVHNQKIGAHEKEVLRIMTLLTVMSGCVAMSIRL